MAGRTPVSYTHLTLTRLALVVVFTAAVSIADQYSWGYLAALVTFILAACTDWLDAVSYTHLDVYKRQAVKETEEERNRRMEWWRDAKFGMFIHYGLYSGLAGEWKGKPGGSEWIQKNVERCV